MSVCHACCSRGIKNWMLKSVSSWFSGAIASYTMMVSLVCTPDHSYLVSLCHLPWFIQALSLTPLQVSQWFLWELSWWEKTRRLLQEPQPVSYVSQAKAQGQQGVCQLLPQNEVVIVSLRALLIVCSCRMTPKPVGAWEYLDWACTRKRGIWGSTSLILDPLMRCRWSMTIRQDVPEGLLSSTSGILKMPLKWVQNHSLWCLVLHARCMSSLSSSLQAKERAPGEEIDGRKIRVDFSITERAHTPTPGIYLGKPTKYLITFWLGALIQRDVFMSALLIRCSRGYRNSRRSPSPYGGYHRRSYYSRSRSRSRSYTPRKSSLLFSSRPYFVLDFP